MRARLARAGLAALLVATTAVYASAQTFRHDARPADHASRVSTTVPVIRCPTRFGAQQKVVWPRKITARGSPSSVRGLVAYSNSQVFLIGPAGLACSGIVAVDGGQLVTTWPRGHAAPRQHTRSDGQTLWLDPACAGCKAADACPFFRTLAASLGFPCTHGVATGERVYHLSSRITLFEDPPGVAGSGWPSSGPDPANGVVGLQGNPAFPLVYRSTCTLPASQHRTCTVSLNDVITRYG